MKHKHVQAAFTIVELIVAIVLIGILTSIVITQYGSIQRDARDSQVRAAAAQFADAIEIWAVRHNGVMPQGGRFSSGTGSPNGPDGCTTPGYEGWQNANYPEPGGYSCTVGDVMLYHDLLPADFFTSLPPTVTYDNNQTNFISVTCPDNDAQTLLLYSLEDPTKAERQDFTDRLAACNQPNTHASDGMNALIVLDASR